MEGGQGLRVHDGLFEVLQVKGHQGAKRRIGRGEIPCAVGVASQADERPHGFAHGLEAGDVVGDSPDPHLHLERSKSLLDAHPRLGGKLLRFT
ncbi:hypothetical protein D3C86_1701680 [compost metagenome]